MSESIKLIPIRYIGKQPKKRDTVLSPPRNIVWHGHGDVQFVPELDAIVYLRYPDIWEHAPDVAPPAPLHGFEFSSPLQAADAVRAGRSAVQAPVGPANTPSVGESVPDSKPEAASISSGEDEQDDPNAPEEPPLGLSEAEERKRVEEIINAIPKLKPGDFDSGGKPQCKSLQRVLRRNVLKAERDAAWDAVKQAMESAA